jgi:3-hydroxyisobutyrate dehydrogenase-like beta-hydroxyacid dehydrogenase
MQSSSHAPCSTCLFDGHAMKSAINFMLILLLCAASSAVGYWYGVSRGADVISELASDNRRAAAFSTIRLSLAALARNDLEFSRNRHQQDIRQALSDLENLNDGLSTTACTDREKQTIEAARKYLSDTSVPVAEGTPPSTQDLAVRAAKIALDLCG